MEFISQTQFLSAEELEKLVEIYKFKLYGGGTSSSNRRPNLLEKGCGGVVEEQRGQFYEVYMKKREVKLREEWRCKGADREAELRAMMDSLDSTSLVMMSKGKVAGVNNDHSGQTNLRKFSKSNIASSTSQSSSTSALNSTIRYSNSASTRMENTNPSKETNNVATMQRGIARSMSSSERTSLVKDIKFSRSQTLRKNPVSVGVRKDFTLQNSRPETSTPPARTNHQRRNSMATFEDYEDIQQQMFSNGSFNSAYHRFENRSKIAEILNSRSSHLQNIYHSKTCDFDSSVGSLPFDPTTGVSHNMNQYFEGKTVRVRKKWGGVESPFRTVVASPHNDKGDGHDSRNYSSEDSRNSRLGRIPSFGSFEEREILHEQVNFPHNQSQSARLRKGETPIGKLS